MHFEFTNFKIRITFISLLILGTSILNFGFGQNQFLSFKNGFVEKQNQNTLPQRTYKSNNGSGIELSYTFTGATVSSKEVMKTSYQFLHVDGFHKMGQVGAPALPAHKEVIAMPRGANGNITITTAEYVEYSGFFVHPALEPGSDVAGSEEPEFIKDETVYSANNFFPENIVEIVNTGLNRGVPLAFTEIRPVQFNPVTGVVRVYTDISFTVDFVGGEGSFSSIGQENSRHFTNLLKLKVINSDDIPNGVEVDSKSGNKNYILVTNDEYLEAAKMLANWKRQLGYSVDLVSQSEWTAAQVKEAIHSRYESWTPKPDFFAILGDHAGAYAVPGDIRQDGSYYDDFATDLYYACMDGASDWHPDMAHGRISVSSSEEALVVVNKIINYEKNPPEESSFYSDMLSCAQYQDDDNNGYADRRFCHTSENIRDYLMEDHGYNSTRVYYTETSASISNLRYNNEYYSNGELLPEDLRSNSFNWNGGASGIISAIDDGKFMVFHRDHGYSGGIGWAHPEFLANNSYGADHIIQLSNGDLLPVIFSMNCHTGEFLLDECFAEEFMRVENKGAVGVIGASYYSLSGYNDALSLGMVDAIWADPGVYPVMGTAGSGANYTIGAGNEIYTMGDVLNQGLYAMEQNVSWSSERQYEYEIFHYFGDPAMKMWIENPHNNVISASHPSEIDCNGSSFEVTNSTPGAIATLVYGDMLIGSVELDANGNGTIIYQVVNPGVDAYLTISKNHHKPYVAEVELVGDCQFPPIVLTKQATELTEHEAVLNGTVADNMDATITECGFVYSLNVNPEIGGENVIQIDVEPVDSGDFNSEISNLSSSTTYYYRAYAVSENGLSYGDQVSFSTLCGIVTSFPFTQDFSSGDLPMCWENISNNGNGEVWAFDNPGGITFNSTTSSNGFALLNSDNYGSGGNQDADLITPVMNFAAYTNIELSFEHYYKDYQSEEASLYYSIDGGNTWNLIQTWSGSDTDNPEVYTVDLTEEFEGQSNARLKWNYVGSYGWYWAVDDILLTAEVGTTYPITFQVEDSNNHPVTGATIDVFNQQVATDANGEAVVEIPDGEHSYIISKEGYDDYTGLLTVNGDSFTEVVQMELSTYLVSFNLVDADLGTAIEGAVVEVTDYGTQTSNQNGIAQFDGFYAGTTLDYSVTATGYAEITGTVEVNGDENPIVEMTGVNRVTFYVVDATNQNVLQNALVDFGVFGQLTTDEFGNAAFENIPPATDLPYTVSMEGYSNNSGFAAVSGDATINVELIEYVNVTFVPVATHVTCYGSSDGAIEFTNPNGGSGEGYQYSIDGGANWSESAVFTGLIAGSYSTMAKDNENQTSEIETVILNQPTEITFETTIQNVSEFGGDDGAIMINANGGTGAFEYSINEGETWQESNTFGGLVAGTYSVVVCDVMGCLSYVDEVEVDQPEQTIFICSFEITASGSSNTIEGAVININGTTLTTNSSGEASLELENGTYDYTVTADGYIDQSRSVTINGSDVTEQVALELYVEPTYSVSFLVLSGGHPVVDATININNVDLITDYDGKASIELENGTYAYTVSKNSFGEITGEVVVADQDESITIEMVGVESADNAVRIYPNPSKGTVFVETPEYAIVTVTNMIGKVVLTSTINKVGELNLQNVPEGMYFVKIEQNGLVITKRIVINK